MLTLSELASYAGVTVRAVRHHHAKGLLPEPQRDASGYRRYDAGAVVDLIRIRRLQRHRSRIARLAAGDSLALPPDAVEYLHRMRELGFPEPMIEEERDAWILIAAHSPEQMPGFIAEKRRQIEDPEQRGWSGWTEFKPVARAGAGE